MIKAHRRFYTQNLFHRETFAQNSFYTCFFYTKNIWHRKTCTHRLHTNFLQTHFIARETLSRTKFTQQNLFRTEAFIHKNKYAQHFLQTDSFDTQKIFRTKFLRTKGFTHNIFYIQTLLHTDVFTPTQIAHRNLCTQHAFTHSQLLHREALLPLLVHLPFVFPLSSLSSFLFSDSSHLCCFICPCCRKFGL